MPLYRIMYRKKFRILCQITLKDDGCTAAKRHAPTTVISLLTLWPCILLETHQLVGPGEMRVARHETRKSMQAFCVWLTVTFLQIVAKLCLRRLDLLYAVLCGIQLYFIYFTVYREVAYSFNSSTNVRDAMQIELFGIWPLNVSSARQSKIALGAKRWMVKRMKWTDVGWTDRWKLIYDYEFWLYTTRSGCLPTTIYNTYLCK